LKPTPIKKSIESAWVTAVSAFFLSFTMHYFIDDQKQTWPGLYETMVAVCALIFGIHMFVLGMDHVVCHALNKRRSKQG